LGKFDPYKVDLKNMASDIQEYEYRITNQFFTDIDGDEVQKGKVNVNLTVKKLSGMFEFLFTIEGVIIISCDRCLDDMDFPVSTSNRLIVKLGADYSEENDEIVIIPRDEGVINLAWFIYEFIALTIPIKHVHAPGKCNKTMSSKLKKHSVRSTDEDDIDADDPGDIIITDEDESSTDPRWDALKGLNKNDD
jgi:Predicted metal-binding, possibly nucleic acid-binding protein